MEFKDLTKDETLALVGLAKLVVRADHTLSTEESSRLSSLAEAVGTVAWADAVAEAKLRLKTEGDARATADLVVRPAARALIHGELKLLAGSDREVASERAILNWLAQAWGISA